MARILIICKIQNPCLSSGQLFSRGLPQESAELEWTMINFQSNKVTKIIRQVLRLLPQVIQVGLLSHSVMSDSLALFLEFSRQEYWSGLPFPTPANLSNPGIEPSSLASYALADEFFPTEPPEKLQMIHYLEN